MKETILKRTHEQEETPNR